jgi:branched-chain amino acid transport system ATP-binding protein
LAGREKPVLETRDLTIRFGGHVAVDHVSCAFAPGTLTAIVGPNGAGKTTYFNLISGQLPPARAGAARRATTSPAAGAVAHAPRPGPRIPAHAAVPQPQRARERAPGGAGARIAAGRRARPVRVWLDRKAWIDEARQILESGAPGRQARRACRSLPHGDQRKLEVALLMALDPKVFMFDEPTAGMSVDEVPVVLDLIRAEGSARRLILLVEHKMDVVRELSDRIIVLHNGRWWPTASRPR